MDEIKGMADGSGLSFELLFTMNLRVELNHLSSNYPENCEIVNGKECTDYHLVNESNVSLGENLIFICFLFSHYLFLASFDS